MGRTKPDRFRPAWAWVIACLVGLVPDAGAQDAPTDRIIVRLSEPSLARAPIQRDDLAARLGAKASIALRSVRTIGDATIVMQLPRRIPVDELRSRFTALREPGVAEIVPDRLFFPAAVPSDPQHPSQWYLNATSGINAPAAWDVTTGASGLVIGILDTGKLPHEELAGRWVGGYDFVSVAERANDGNLRDTDPSDPGDWVTAGENASGALQGCPVANSHWHGTSMAGVIGAATGNGTGIAGINWSSKLLPVRVVGKCGGYESDIADGLRWAAGISVAGVPANANPADVLNVSLATLGACSTVLQAAIDDVVAAGVPVIAAAGNNTVDAGGYSPGNCSGVITVAAVDRNGGKAGYTNFGSSIALAAPGGKSPEHFGTGDTADNQWILTTGNAGTTTPSGNNAYYFDDFGTSIAAAQVTGVASLVLSVNPALTPSYVREILRNTTRAFPTNTTTLPAPSQADCTQALCGLGIVDTQVAVQAAAQWGNTAPRVVGGGDGSLFVSASGGLYDWGQFQQPSAYTGHPTPVGIASIAGVVGASRSIYHALALRADGTVWGWGSEQYGELGGTFGSSTPVRIGGFTRVVALAAGSFYTLVLKRDGTVWGLGRNDDGRLGDGTTTSRSTPVQAAGLSGVVAIAVSNAHRILVNYMGTFDSARSYALKGDGTVWAWGSGLQATAAPMAGIAGVTAIAAGEGHVLALKGDGSVWAHGRNASGQLGNGSTIDSGTWVQVASLANIAALASGPEFSVALRNDGTVWAWGSGYGNVPVQVAGASGITAVASGLGAGYAYKNDGSVWRWSPSSPIAHVPGVGGMGYLWLAAVLPDFVGVTGAANAAPQVSNPILVTGIANGASISVANGTYSIGCTGTFTASASSINAGQAVCVQHTASANCATTTSATLTIAGLAPKPFSVTTVACDFTPEPFELQTQWGVAPGTPVTSNSVFISGINGNAPISVAGGAYSIGCTGTFTTVSGTIANNESVCVRQTAAATPDTATVATLAVGTYSTRFTVISAVAPGFNVQPRVRRYMGIRSDGTLVTSGYPGAQAILGGVVEADSGGTHTLAVRTGGTVWAWGNNDYHQLGDGTTQSSSSPQQVAGLANITAVAAGLQHSLALRSDGTVWAWGGNAQGQLGDGTTVERSAPVQVPLSGAVAIGTYDRANVAITSDGRIWAWGTSTSVSSINFVTSTSPVQLGLLTGAAGVAVGSDHVMVRRNDGTVWTLGGNNFGQLGNGNTTASSVFAQVVGLANVVDIAAADWLSRAVKSDGTLWSWGRNFNGELGDGTSTPRSLPVAFAGVNDGIGISSRLLLRSDGSVWTLDGGSPPARRFVGFNGEGYLWLGAYLDHFVDVTDAALGSAQRSNPVIVTGIANGAAISISGGEYSIGCSGTFTTASGTLNPGQSVCLRVAASGSCGTTTVATLTVAGLAPRAFRVTAMGSCDWTPSLFSFSSRGNVAPGASADSRTTIYDIQGAAPVSVTGGVYSVGCTGTFTSSPGTITDGQDLCVRAVASGTPGGTTTAVVTVGSVSAPFVVFTAMPSAFTVTPGIAPGLGLRSDGMLFNWFVGYESVTFPITSISGVTRANGGLAVRFDGSVWSTDSAHGSWAPVPGLSNIGIVVDQQSSHYAIQSNGTLWVWGDNQFGRLGDGTTISRETPVQALVSGVVAVAPYSYVSTPSIFFPPTFHEGAYAVKADGSVWAWGSGWLPGVGPTPSQVAGISGAVRVAAGNAHLVVLKSDGTVWARGANDQGQLGNGTTIASPSAFTQVGNLAGISAVAAQSAMNWALRNDGTVWRWGQGMLVPIQVPGLESIVAITEAFALRQDGTVWWLDTVPAAVPAVLEEGILLLQLQNTRPSPFTFLPALGLAPGDVATSGRITVAGLGNVASPIAVTGGTYSVNGGGFTSAPGTVVNGDTVAVRAGAPGTFSTTATATVTIGGATGQSGTFVVRTRDDLSQARGVPRVAGGSSHTYVLASDGVVYAAGYNGNGQLGNGSTLGSSTLRPVAGLGGVLSVASGAFHGLALRNDATVAAWGANTVGQLGHGSAVDSEKLFVAVPGLAGVASIAAGGYHSLARLANGTVWSWGLNTDGQLGDGTAGAYRRAPAQVAGITNAIAIAAGARHTLVLLFDGTVLAWGANEKGQLGDGTTASRSTAAPVAALADVIAIAAGDAHSLALKRDGTVVAWGFNAFGQLGVGDTADRLRPTALTSLGSGAGLITAGANHSMAVKIGGAIYAWGNNANSQVGNASNANQLVPTAIARPTGAVAIAGGARHSAALDARRQLFLWGDNFFGQVGNRSGNYNPHSASLNVLRGDSVISSGLSSSDTSVGTASSSGSSVLLVDGLGTGFDFGSSSPGGNSAIGGRYRNQAALENITGIAVSVSGSAFSLSANGCPATLVPDQECSFSVTFNPPATGTFSGELMVASSVVGSPESRSLFGVGLPPTAPAIAFGSGGVDFPPQSVGVASAAESIPVTNTGTAALTIGAITSSIADFAASHNCSAIAAGATCLINVTFTPSQVGARTGYLTIASNAAGTVLPVTVFGTGAASSALPPPPPANPPRLFNISTRMQVLTGNDVMIAGFIVGGSTAKTVVVNVAGPSLVPFGITNALLNPALTLVRSSDQAVLATNDNWQTQSNPSYVAAIQASGFQPNDAAEPAIIATLAPGAYTAIVEGSGGATGVGLVGVFEVDHPEIPLINISTRGQVQAGNDVMIAGFIIQGSGAQKVVINVAGPSLVPFGINNALTNPSVTLVRSSDQQVLATNDDWQTQANPADVAAIQATGFQPNNVAEPAIIATLPPGAYTAIVSGVGGATGVALVGVFAAP